MSLDSDLSHLLALSSCYLHPLTYKSKDGYFSNYYIQKAAQSFGINIYKSGIDRKFKRMQNDNFVISLKTDVNRYKLTEAGFSYVVRFALEVENMNNIPELKLFVRKLQERGFKNMKEFFSIIKKNLSLEYNTDTTFQSIVNDGDFEYLLEWFERKDSEILLGQPFKFDSKKGNKERIKLFENYLEKILKFSPNPMEILNSKIFSKRIQNNLPNISMEINLDTNLDSIQFITDTDSITLVKPKLMWECSCNLPTFYKNIAYTCRIHKTNSNQQLSKKFRENMMYLKYGNTKIFWRNDAALWPPSIESFQMIKSLRNHGFEKRDDIKKILDIGCGTGFLGICMTNMIKSSKKETHFSDLYLEPLFVSALNCQINIPTIKRKFFHSNNFSKIKEEKYDLIISNPPYLPLFGIRELESSSPIAGTDLLENLIISGKKHTKELVFLSSKLVSDELENCMSLISPKKQEILDSFSVPFRVSHATKNKKYHSHLKRLLSKNSNKIFERKSNSFKIWHTIDLWRIIF